MMRINQLGRIYSSKFNRQFEVKRLYGEHSAWGFDGEYVSEVITGIITPTSPSDMQVLPEQERYLPTIVVFTKDSLAIGDIVVFNGHDYKVKTKEDWSDYGYFHYLAVRYSETAHPDSGGFDIT
ncbi:hypothetical protein [Pelistega sp. MC2]|uniref:hypothetical protein n=1 Tax=Pelistega sp. MC2 TaxID=1720297 RepID=UPI00115FDAD4|nr:hypothetical protein [Pelistega sp. MC2]